LVGLVTVAGKTGGAGGSTCVGCPIEGAAGGAGGLAWPYESTPTTAGRWPLTGASGASAADCGAATGPVGVAAGAIGGACGAAAGAVGVACGDVVAAGGAA
jgi:hypothetical protein